MINPAIPLLYARAKALRAQADALEMRAVCIHLREQQAMPKNAHTAKLAAVEIRPDPSDAIGVLNAAVAYLPSWREPAMRAAVSASHDLLAVAELILARPRNKTGGVGLSRTDIDMLALAVEHMRSMPDATH